MNLFKKTMLLLDEQLYKPNNLMPTTLKEENFNQDYSGGTFTLAKKTIRFRVAKITPKKSGQFVAIWEKDPFGKNSAFDYSTAPDLLVVTCFKEQRLGQFIFPKQLLLQKKILKNQQQRGKMAFRIYPSWDHPTSKQAIATQVWQLPYFVTQDTAKKQFSDKIQTLYKENDYNEFTDF